MMYTAYCGTPEEANGIRNIYRYGLLEVSMNEGHQSNE